MQSNLISGTIDIHPCDVEEVTLQMDGIEVTISPNVIPQGKVVHAEMGVASFGPFTFADNCQPVSPFLWFCIQENIEFELPVTFKLPHVLRDTTGAALSFAKAGHSSNETITHFKTNDTDSANFVFERCPYGILTSNHRCFLCIQAAASLRDLSLQKGYCLHIIIKKEDSLTYQIIIACTYFLPTCIKVCLTFIFVLF